MNCEPPYMPIYEALHDIIARARTIQYDGKFVVFGSVGLERAFIDEQCLAGNYTNLSPYASQPEFQFMGVKIKCTIPSPALLLVCVTNPYLS